MTATAETKTFPTRKINQRHQLDRLAVGAYIVDGFGRGVVKSDANWFKHDDHEFEVRADGIALPAEVLDEGDVPFQPGDRVRVVATPYDGVPNGTEGVVRQFNGVYWAVHIDGQNSGISNGEFLFTDSEIEVAPVKLAGPIEVGDTVRLVSTMWDGKGSAIRSGIEGVVKSLPSDDNPYFMVDFAEYGRATDNFPLREHEFVLISKAPKLGDFVHSFTVQLADISEELLDLVFGKLAPVYGSPAAEVGQVVAVEEQIEALRNGTVLVDPNNPHNIFVKRGGEMVKPGQRDTFNDEALVVAQTRGLRVIHTA